MSHEEDAILPSNEEKLDTQKLDINTQSHGGRDRSTSDAYFPPNPPPSSPQGIASVPFALPSPFSGEVDTSFSRSIDAVLATETEREVAEEARKQVALSKRASNVLKLTQERQDLEKELKEMADRLEAIEKRSQELVGRTSNPSTPGATSPPAGS